MVNCEGILDDGNPCGDEGRICDDCADKIAREYRWMRHVPLGAITGTLSDQDRLDLRDAGRL